MYDVSNPLNVDNIAQKVLATAHVQMLKCPDDHGPEPDPETRESDIPTRK